MPSSDGLFANGNRAANIARARRGQIPIEPAAPTAAGKDITEELRRVWRTLHHTGPPMGLSRDLIIRGLADKLQQRAHAGPSRALQRHFGFWRTSSRKALVLSIPVER